MALEKKEKCANSMLQRSDATMILRIIHKLLCTKFRKLLMPTLYHVYVFTVF